MISLLLFVFLLLPQYSHAYLDGGTGSMLLQIILGGSGGIAVLIKLYWHKIKNLFKKNRDK
jgi:hypothetical protein